MYEFIKNGTHMGRRCIKITLKFIFIVYRIAIMIYDKLENTDDCLLNYPRKKVASVWSKVPEELTPPFQYCFMKDMFSVCVCEFFP